MALQLEHFLTPNEAIELAIPVCVFCQSLDLDVIRTFKKKKPISKTIKIDRIAVEYFCPDCGETFEN